MPGVSSSNYDVTPDGQRFVMVKEQSGSLDGAKVVVVLNWSRGLKDLPRADTPASRAAN
jgi:hypothetical protein